MRQTRLFSYCREPADRKVQVVHLTEKRNSKQVPAVSQYGVNASVLNAIGESDLGLGKLAEALAAFEKLLQLSPDQPEIQKKVEGLKTKK